MKKFFFLLLTMSAGLNLYLLDSEYMVEDDFEDMQPIERVQTRDEVKVAQSSVAKDLSLDSKDCSCTEKKK